MMGGAKMSQLLVLLVLVLRRGGNVGGVWGVEAVEVVDVRTASPSDSLTASEMEPVLGWL